MQTFIVSFADPNISFKSIFLITPISNLHKFNLILTYYIIIMDFVVRVSVAKLKGNEVAEPIGSVAYT